MEGLDPAATDCKEEGGRFTREARQHRARDFGSEGAHEFCLH